MIERISDILIVTDVDGTLLREADGLSAENREAIKRFTDKGGHFTVSTGRAIEACFGRFNYKCAVNSHKRRVFV